MSVSQCRNVTMSVSQCHNVSVTMSRCHNVSVTIPVSQFHVTISVSQFQCHNCIPGFLQYIAAGSDNFKIYLWHIPKERTTENSVISSASRVLRGHRSVVNQVSGLCALSPFPPPLFILSLSLPSPSLPSLPPLSPFLPSLHPSFYVRHSFSHQAWLHSSMLLSLPI